MLTLRGKIWELQQGSENRAGPVGASYVLTLSFWEASFPHLQMRTIIPGVAENEITHAKCWYSAWGIVGSSKPSSY